ncbi:VOC family protein [Kaistella faecalis]|uniref:VOC family protein n=1 Tax=Kaistella faecalis TaxID=2852098 RepID=UPI001C4960FD|nr:VOC family protein [Chryseobacterium faecale]UFK98177.1 VOC family protein [Chryseobacterium faecale]
MISIQKIHTILYVENQEISTDFYTKILQQPKQLNVPGMTEFELSSDFVLGLMPNQSIVKILGDKTVPPASGTGIPRCELYLYVDDIEAALKNIHENQIAVISGLQERNWGDMAFYFADPDGHIIAFAKKIKN